jgi:hypothetical protein
VKASLLIKILFLVAVLVVVIGGIRGLNPQNIEKAFDAIGVEAGNSQSPGFQAAGSRPLQPGEERFNLCRTRIIGAQWPNGNRVEEAKDGLKLKWMADDPEPREISSIEVEKWLSRHCQVIVKAIDPAKLASDGEVEKASAKGDPNIGHYLVRYVDGTDLKISTANGVIFKIGDKAVESTDLHDALAELRETVQLK